MNELAVHRFAACVCLARHHPLFGKYQYGLFCVWLLDASVEAAKARAHRLISELPVELVILSTIDSYPLEFDRAFPWVSECELAVLDCGIALHSVMISADDVSAYSKIAGWIIGDAGSLDKPAVPNHLKAALKAAFPEPTWRPWMPGGKG